MAVNEVFAISHTSPPDPDSSSSPSAPKVNSETLRVQKLGMEAKELGRADRKVCEGNHGTWSAVLGHEAEWLLVLQQPLRVVNLPPSNLAG